jgi:hypothetical protein
MNDITISTTAYVHKAVAIA